MAANGDSAVVICLSSKLSGTYQSACIAAESYDNIYVVDSQSVAIGTGVLAQYAVDCADAGISAREIAQMLEKKKADVTVIALLDTLEYLKKGGRISKTVAFAGGVLNIKPVVTVQDGVVALIGKARGSRNGNNLLVEKINQSGGVDFSVVGVRLGIPRPDENPFFSDQLFQPGAIIGIDRKKVLHDRHLPVKVIAGISRVLLQRVDNIRKVI